MATPIPENRVELSLGEIGRATGGELRAGNAQSIRGVTTDSRRDVSGKLFVALEGESFDGHAFVADVAKRGVAAVLVSRDVDVPSHVGVVRVPNTLHALGAIAHAHRQRWGGTVVGVAGSAGKTTTKGAVAAALEAVAPGAVHAEAGNLNNLIGVPMVLLSITERDRIAVVEIGTNAPGEVERLAAMARPDIAVLTLIALEHTEGLGDLDGIEAEEGALFAALGAAGTAIGNGDDPRVLRQLSQCPARTRLTYGVNDKVDYRVVERAQLDATRAELTLSRPKKPGALRVRTTLLGVPGALAVAAALAVVDHVGKGELDAVAFQRAIDRLGTGEPGRLTPVTLADGSVLVDDTYNANPASIQSAVTTAREIAAQNGARVVLVLGEMRELGALSRREHEALGTWLGQSGAAELVAIAGDAEHLARTAREAGLDAVFAESSEAALPLVLARLEPGDVILVKASRGVRAERVVEGIVRAKGSAA